MTWPARSRRTVLAAPLAAAVLLIGSGCSSGSDEQRGPEWKKGAGAPETAAYMKVDVPGGATEVKGAVKLVPQDAVQLLTFVTTPKEAEALGRQFEGQGPLIVRPAQSAQPTTDPSFAHLGTPEPESLTGLRWAGVCPPCVKDKQRTHMQWIEIYLQKLDADRTRVYLRAW
ncbi:hypothetical protein [Streptomyces sp. NBC_01353]|uniref:hypothetical protein n=1 Tax=Streptomyces sp. NBC_01353 TaxID=2903835 RepID=UPI002E364C64|nr:hypothetical protein [Streptomyces sp. NBC_01353]